MGSYRPGTPVTSAGKLDRSSQRLDNRYEGSNSTICAIEPSSFSIRREMIETRAREGNVAQLVAKRLLAIDNCEVRARRSVIWCIAKQVMPLGGRFRRFAQPSVDHT